MLASEFITELWDKPYKDKSVGLGNINLDEGLKQNAAAALVGLGLAGAPTPTANVEPSVPHTLAVKPARALTDVENMIKNAAKTAGIKGHELAQLLAHAAHETGNYVAMEELGGKKYLMKKYWDNHNKRIELGNKHPSDAVRYKGRGFIQLTGRGNYDKMGKILDINLIKYPELASRPDIAARIAVVYFKNRVEPEVSDFRDTKAVTNKINPHDKPSATKDRDEKYHQYTNLLGLKK